jgi:hypothetical protein
VYPAPDHGNCPDGGKAEGLNKCRHAGETYNCFREVSEVFEVENDYKWASDEDNLESFSIIKNGLIIDCWGVIIDSPPALMFFFVRFSLI